jgi:hypothetical protein
MTFEAFQSAVASLNVRAQPQVVRALFERIGAGGGPASPRRSPRQVEHSIAEDSVSVRNIQRALWGEDGGSDRKSGSEALHLAVKLGVALPLTQRDDRAAEHMYTDENVHRFDGLDRFDWETGSGAGPRRSAAAYRQVGDPRYETPEALQRRLALLRAPSIVRACRQFWDTLRLDEDGTMHRGQYMEVHRLLTAALAPEMDEAEWREAAEEDYTDDQRGHTSLNLARSIMSIFEVADLWTDSVEEWQYVCFINKLYRRVTKPRVSRKSLWSQAAAAAAVHGAKGGVARVAGTKLGLVAAAALARKAELAQAMARSRGSAAEEAAADAAAAAAQAALQAAAPAPKTASIQSGKSKPDAPKTAPAAGSGRGAAANASVTAGTAAGAAATEGAEVAHLPIAHLPSSPIAGGGEGAGAKGRQFCELTEVRPISPDEIAEIRAAVAPPPEVLAFIATAAAPPPAASTPLMVDPAPSPSRTRRRREGEERKARAREAAVSSRCDAQDDAHEGCDAQDDALLGAHAAGAQCSARAAPAPSPRVLPSASSETMAGGAQDSALGGLLLSRPLHGETPREGGIGDGAGGV